MNRRQFFGGAILTAAAAGPLKSLRASETMAEARNRLADDPHRPQFHFLPAANWMNDPNGPIFWNGKYHMFYQYNPHAAVWGDMHWGHAISSDMIHWQHLPIALAPTPGGPDSEGCFSGTAAVQDGRVVMLYTGVRASSLQEGAIKGFTAPLKESQCLAIADDADLKTWTKESAPVIANPPPGLEVNGFRDPSPWRQGAWWYMVCASGIANEGGAVLLYRSSDLRKWEFQHIFARHNPSGDARFGSFEPWEVWECPEFFRLNDWHVLIYSTGSKTYWQSGKLDTATMHFHPEHAGIVDYGCYYAAKTQLDEAGNRIIWGWVRETRPKEEYQAAGWAGLMSLPRILSTTPAGELRIDFARQLQSLRREEQRARLARIEESDLKSIEAVALESCCGEVVLTVRRSGAPFEAILVTDSGNAPVLHMHYDSSRDRVSIDRRPIRLQLVQGEPLEFHFYADGSVVELLVNRQIAWTKRFYSPAKTTETLRMKILSKTAPIQRLSFWQITPISPDRLTS